MNSGAWKISITQSLPPCGGSGLKCRLGKNSAKKSVSPSVWREWIEIQIHKKSPLGHKSPSVWREWIEIPVSYRYVRVDGVSLRVEGVD